MSEHTPSAKPVQRGMRVRVVEHEWERGLVDLEGTVVGRLSDTYVQVRVDDGLLVAAPIELCTVLEVQ